MRIFGIALLLPLLASCGGPVEREEGRAEVWVVQDSNFPAYSCELDPEFAHALHAREGKRTSAGFMVLEDDLADEEIGRVVFSVAGAEYTYPIMKCEVPQDGAARYAWHGPQNDMRIQHWSRDSFFVNLGICIDRKSANKALHATR
jgi:hypothetical protein